MKNKSVLKRVFGYLKPYSFLTVLSFIFSAGAAVLLLYIPVLAGKMIDLAIGFQNVDLEGLARLAVISVVIAVVASVLQWLTNVINNRIVYFIIRDIRKDAYQKISTLPLSVLDVKDNGDIISRVISDVDTFADGLLLGFSQFFQGIVTIAVTLVFMFTLNWIIALVVVFVTPLSVFTAKFIASRTYSKFKEQSQTKGELTALVNECFENQKLVKAYDQGDELTKKFDEINERLEKSAVSATFFSSLTNPTTRFINSVVYLSVAVSGALICITNPATMTVGVLSSLLAYSNRYTKPFNEISDTITEMQNAFACAERVFELLDEKSEEQIGERISEVDGHIKVENLYFSYVQDKPLLQNVNIDAVKGKHVAIVGPTGCGKTTLINLLMKFYSPDEGDVYIDGKNYKDLNSLSIRQNYGMVLQETWLKSGATVKENVAFGVPDSTDEAVIQALKESGAWGFVSRMEKGIDTVITEDAALSQGQKQLLCIARVILKMPPILILDEATSSIDTNTEMKIQRSFAVLTKGKTSFTVAHRLSTIQDADIILVMKDGNVIEQGTHEELLKLNGFYAELLRSLNV